jgi:O-antigen ligase
MPDAPPPDGDESVPLLWRWLPLRLALAALPLAPTFTVLAFNVGPFIRSIAAVTLGVTLVSPVHGLLLTAAIAPFGELIAASIGATNFRISEVVVLAFLTGWLLRWMPDRRGPRVAAAAAGWLFAIAVAASIAGLAWQLGRYPGELPATIDQIVHGYFYSFERIGLVDGARLLEGMALAAATVILFRRHPTLANTLPLTLAASASVAALSSVLLWRGIGTAAALQRYQQIGYRVSAHVGDVNAAGSYFGMIVCVALGMAMRNRGGRQVLWWCLAAASGAGLWFSESRSALGAAGALVIVGVLWAATSQFTTRARAAALAVVVIALLGGAAVRAMLLGADRDYRGVGFRQQFVLTSVRMIAARPLFGVGEGRYYPSSPLFLSPELATSYGAENAHNFFLQVGGELGLVGFVLFAIWLIAPLTRTARAVARAPRDARLLGVGSGVAAFIITCLTGHPFLVGEVAYPFWLLFGLMTALAGAALLSDAGRVGRSRASWSTLPALRWLAAAAAIVILVASPITTATGAVIPSESRGVNGLFEWETLSDGTRFRWTGRYASLFVPADVTRVEIPVRLPTDGRSIPVMGVEAMTGGVGRGRTLVDANWAIISLPLDPVLPPIQYKRIDLRIDRVWQPALYIAGSADMRKVGVQVGELRLFRE